MLYVYVCICMYMYIYIYLDIYTQAQLVQGLPSFSKLIAQGNFLTFIYSLYMSISSFQNTQIYPQWTVYTTFWYIHWWTKVALVKLPTVSMCGFFFYTPFPPRILIWSCVVPRSSFHPPKAFNLIDLKAGDNCPSTPATRNGLGNVIRGWPRWMLCQASRSINFVPPEVNNVCWLAIPRNFP